MKKQTWKRQQRQDAAIRALAAGCSPQRAADQAGVAKSTIYRWLDRTDFQALLREAKGEARRPAPSPPAASPGDRFADDPAVAEAREAYVAAARKHFGEVPVDPHYGVPDPRWWLRLRDAGMLPDEVEEARQRFNEARGRALSEWRRERNA